MWFKDLLKDLRDQAGLTQAALAGKTGLPIGTIQGYEQGTRVPSWPAAVWLAEALDVPVDRFSRCADIEEAKQRRTEGKSTRRRSGRGK
jgi:transcriptional regulator with XRE-family HTH domain